MQRTKKEQVNEVEKGRTTMKIPFILVLLSFLTKVACSNGQSRKKSLSPSKQCEKNIDSIDIAKNMKVSNEDIDDSLFNKSIIMDDGAKSGLHRIWFILSDISFLKK